MLLGTMAAVMVCVQSVCVCVAIPTLHMDIWVEKHTPACIPNRIFLLL